MSGARKIFDAIDEGDIGKLRAVLNPTDIDQYNGETTALFYAVSSKSRKEIVKILCSVDNIDVNKGSRSGGTPLSEAVRLNSADIIKLLCQNKRVNIFHEDWATKEKLEDMFESEVFYSLLVRLILEKEGPKELDVSKRNKRGDSFLHMAVLSEQPDAINYFCEHTDVDHQAKNEKGSTAFDLIFPPGVDLDTCICGSNLLLQIACKTRGKDVVSRKDSEGRTVLHLAVLEGDKEAVKTLYDENKDDVDINAADAMGNTPFSLAIDNNMEDIALFLLSKPGVKIDVSDHFKDGIFQIFRRIVLKKESENRELSFVLENYLTEEAVPEGRRGTIQGSTGIPAPAPGTAGICIFSPAPAPANSFSKSRPRPRPRLADPNPGPGPGCLSQILPGFSSILISFLDTYFSCKMQKFIVIWAQKFPIC